MLRYVLLLLLFTTAKALAQIPTINSFTPQTGVVGTTVTLSGTGFNSSAANNVVFFGGVKASVKSATNNSITVNVPAGSQNSPISVINLTTGLQGTSTKTFYTTFIENGTNKFQAGSFTAQSFTEQEHGGFQTYLNLTDVDNDGKLDIIVTNSFDQTVNIYRNNIAAGSNAPSFYLAATFGVTPSYLTYSPQEVKFADLDGDGKQDLVIPYLEQGKVGVYKNNTIPGSISRDAFSSEIQFNLGGTSRWISVADLDTDGKPEIISTNVYGVTILRNMSLKGALNSSSFAARQDIKLSNSTNSVEAGDIDGDGKSDLLVGCRGSISILKNTTSGSSFAFAEKSISVGGERIYAYMADLDGDGRSDIAITNFEKNDVYLLQNTTANSGNDITLGSLLTLKTKWPISNLRFSDLNGDAHPEIITTPYGGEITAFINNNKSGNITNTAFGPEIPLAGGGRDWTSNAVGDLDNNGKPDIVNNDGQSTITVLYNNIVGNPKITGFSPTSAKPGETVIISGQYLASTNSVTFGGTPATKVTVLSPTSVAAVVNRGSTGYITITNYEGRDSVGGFTYNGPPAPQITQFTPTSGGPGTELTINGYNFDRSSLRVTVGGVAPEIKLTSTTQVVVRIDTGATGAVVITDINGTGSLDGFTFTPKPEISKLDKYTGSKGETVTITGRYLETTKAITLGGVPVAAFKVLSSRNVSFVIGDGDAGDLVLKTSFGEVTTGFIYNIGAPTLSNVSTMAAPAGSTIKINGTNFNTLPENNLVYFGTVRGKVTQASSTQLLVTVPSGATFAPISVTVRNYKMSTSKPFILTFTGGTINQTTFGARVNMFAGNSVNTFTIADLNNDGLPDIIVPNYGYFKTSVKLNKSKKGQFKFDNIDGPYYNYSILGAPIFTTSFDQDNDGFVDFMSLTDLGRLIEIHNSNTNFSVRSSFYIGISTNRLVVDDMDGNGTTDILSYGGGQSYQVQTADFDGDNKPDVITGGDKSVTIRRNKFLQGMPFYDNNDFDADFELQTGTSVYNFSVADFDSDGKTDVIALSGENAKETTNLIVYKNISTPGKLAFTRLQSIAVEKEPYRSGFCTGGDVDGDGRVDLLFSSKGRVWVFKNTSTLNKITFANPVKYEADGSKYLTVADFDGDGQTDIAGVGLDFKSSDSQIFILRNLSGTLPVTNIQPAYGPLNTNITITGSGFSGATGVSLAGYNLKNFKIVSDNNITATVDTTISGYVTVTTSGNSGTSLTKYFTADEPVINPADTVYILSGGEATLSANKMGYYTDASYDRPSYGYYVTEYIWSKDGTDIPNAYNATYNANQSGIYTLSLPFYNGDRIRSKPVVIVTMSRLPANNFLISANAATCKGLSNGFVKITSKFSGNFTATLTNGKYIKSDKFSNELRMDNLAAGTYSLCLTPNQNNNLQQCFTIIITEPKDISLYTAVSNDKHSVMLALSGSNRYYVTLNGATRITTDSIVNLPLSKGINQLQVTSDRSCQGVINRTINVETGVVAYPNPLDKILNVNVGEEPVAKARVEIYSAMGALVLSEEFSRPNGTIQVNVSSIKMTGKYMLKLVTDNKPPQTVNLLKL